MRKLAVEFRPGRPVSARRQRLEILSPPRFTELLVSKHQAAAKLELVTSHIYSVANKAECLSPSRYGSRWAQFDQQDEKMEGAET